VQVAKDRRQERCIHRDADPSAGLHLFQELSTLGQQLAHTLLLRQGLSGVKPDASGATTATPFDFARVHTIVELIPSSLRCLSRRKRIFIKLRLRCRRGAFFLRP
jgi:hypothetical protein